MRTTHDLLATLLDAGSLSDLLDRDVVAASARVKPGAQVTIGVVDATTGRAVGWARVLWPTLRVKAAKVAERAARRGQGLTQRELGDLLLQSGTIASDPALGSVVRRNLASRDRPLVDDPSAVLRYNPMRRVLVRDGDVVVRLTARPDALGHALLLRLAGRGLPVPTPLDDGSRPHLARRAFFGDTDLGRTPTVEGMAWAGSTLAALHARGAGLLAEPTLAHLGERPVSADPLRLAADLGSLEPELGRRAGRLAGALAARDPLPGPPTLIHGDASADQVLVDRAEGRHLFNDFDRATVGPAALDLGSWLAAGADGADEAAGADGRGEWEAAFLDGYARAGGVLPGASDLVTARATGLFSRVMTPLRTADPDWRAGVARRLDDLQEVLS